MAILGISMGAYKLDMRQLKLVRKVTGLVHAMDLPRQGELPQLGRSWRSSGCHNFVMLRFC